MCFQQPQETAIYHGNPIDDQTEAEENWLSQRYKKRQSWDSHLANRALGPIFSAHYSLPLRQFEPNSTWTTIKIELSHIIIELPGVFGGDTGITGWLSKNDLIAHERII